MIASPILPFLLAVAVLTAPGALLLRAGGARPRVLWGVAPPVTVLIAVVGGALLHAVGLRWTPLSAALLLAVGAALILSVRLVVHGRTKQGLGAEVDAAPGPGLGSGCGSCAPSSTRSRGRRLLLASIPSLVALLVGAATAASALRGMGSIGTLNGSYDSFFHIAAIRFVRTDGDAFLPTALEGIYGAPTFYPAGWDIIAALLPYDPVTTANAMALAVLAILPAALAAMTGMMLTPDTAPLRRSILQSASALCAPMFLSIPVMILVMGLWPFTLGALCLPPALGALWLLARTARARGPLIRAALPLLLIVGAVATHPTNFFQLALVATGAAAAVVGIALASPAQRRRGAIGLAILILATAIYAAVATIVLRKMDLTAFAHWPWTSQLLSIVMDRPRLTALPVEPWAVAAVWVLVLIGAVAGWRRRSVPLLVLVVVAGLVIGLSMVTNSPVSWARMWTNPWYGARERLAPLLMCALVAIAMHGLGALLDLRARQAHRPSGTWRWRGRAWAAPLALVLLVASSIAAVLVPGRLPLIASFAYTDYGVQLQPYVVPEERDFIVREAQRLPPGSVVIGNPRDGEPLFWSLGGVETVFPTLAEPQTLDSRRVARYLHQATTDPNVCRSWHKVGATHLYVDTSENSGRSIAPEPSEMWEGLEKIPPDRLVLVARDGPYALYRIEPLC